MTSKKYKLLLMVFMFLATATFAQTGGGYDIYDSSVVPANRMGQQNEFWNNSYDFPAKPRNQWEIGGSLGLFNVSGDVSTKPLTFPNFDLHIRKAFGYVFSLRLQYLNAQGKGQNWTAASGYTNNTAWAGYNSGVVYYNYKTQLQDLGLQGIVTLNNIRFHKQKTGIVLYAGAGIGVSAFDTKINALDANGAPYLALFQKVYAQYGGGTYKQRKDIRKALKDGMDDTYETQAQNENTRRPIIGNKTLKPSGTVLAGVAFKLSKRVNLALEDRITFIKTDLLDGQEWEETNTLTRDFDSYNYASLGINVNIGSKAVEPLWWLNPLDYAYSELNNPKHMKLPKPVFNDADGDGVIDELDREPNTPAGCPVDTHGVTKDTDGDGVPDCKDKQLITPTECQPVDADGVGKCPDPACCKNMAAVVTNPCPTDYPSVTFKNGSSSLSTDAKALLATAAAKMKASPTCNISIDGYPEASKASQSLAQKRLDAIKNYLVEKEGISADRISTNPVVGGGDKNIIDIKSN
ncbi:MAG: OmpA family protein [Ferruginibacter sp.]